jgi:threonyl-tRNA synthetase
MARSLPRLHLVPPLWPNTSSWSRRDDYSPIDIEEEKYYLRPMNCPHHHMVYKARPHSYRELPYKIAEYGTVYRLERSGQLHGLMRTRGFIQNDAHIYC